MAWHDPARLHMGSELCAGLGLWERENLASPFRKARREASTSGLTRNGISSGKEMEMDPFSVSTPCRKILHIFQLATCAYRWLLRKPCTFIQESHAELKMIQRSNESVIRRRSPHIQRSALQGVLHHVFSFVPSAYARAVHSKADSISNCGCHLNSVRARLESSLKLSLHARSGLESRCQEAPSPHRLASLACNALYRPGILVPQDQN